jgi:hypothetical protein
LGQPIQPTGPLGSSSFGNPINRVSAGGATGTGSVAFAGELAGALAAGLGGAGVFAMLSSF